MISFKDHRVELMNLPTTIDAIEQLEGLITYYEYAPQGPAYLQIRHAMSEPNIQLDRSFMIEALQSQRRKLIDYLTDMGIDYDKE